MRTISRWLHVRAVLEKHWRWVCWSTFFRKVCAKGGAVCRIENLAGRGLQKAPGNLSGDQHEFCYDQGNWLSGCKKKIGFIVANAYSDHYYLLKSRKLTDADKEFLKGIFWYGWCDCYDCPASAMQVFGTALWKKVLVLLDEYDTPVQEAYVCGYWKEMTGFIRAMFHALFKTNPYLERAVLTGITRVSKESVFSDLNNLKVITTTSKKYETVFDLQRKRYLMH